VFSEYHISEKFTSAKFDISIAYNSMNTWWWWRWETNEKVIGSFKLEDWQHSIFKCSN